MNALWDAYFKNVGTENGMKKNKFTIILFTLLLLFINGCSGEINAPRENSELDEIVYASTKDIRDINPHLYSGEMAAQNMVFEPLVINTDDGVKPWLAESWEISEDGLEYTFHLRQDVTFTDGEPFNARAVKMNMDAILENKSRHAWLDMVHLIKENIVVDEYTYKLVLQQPYYPTLIELGLTRPFRFISPSSFINGTTKEGVNGYVGTGPWILSEHKNDQYARFIANDHYWGEKPKVRAVRWKVMPDHQSILLALEKGDINLIFGSDGDMVNIDSFKALEDQGVFQTLLSEPITSRTILLNSNSPVLNNLQIREAIQYAIDKESIADGLFNGLETAAYTLFAPNVPYANVDLPKRTYNPVYAKELLDRAGWKLGEDRYRYKEGKKLEMTIYFNSDNASERTISEYLQQNLQEVGISLKIVGEEKQAFLDRQKSGKFDLQFSTSWGIPYDPQSFVSSWRIPAHGDYQAQLGLENKEWLDQTITALLIEPDAEKRQKMYTDILSYLHKEAVYVPLTYSRTKAIFDPALKGVTFTQSQYEIPFEKMYFE